MIDPVPVDEYARNIAQAIVARQITRAELAALTSCPTHGKPYAGGALWHGCRVCPACMAEEAPALRELRGITTGTPLTLYRLVQSEASRAAFLAAQMWSKAERATSAREAAIRRQQAYYWRHQARRNAELEKGGDAA